MTGPVDDPAVDEPFDVRGPGPGGVLAAGLRDATQRVAGLDLRPQDRDRLARRLVAIADAAKHDLGRAAARLDALLAELDSAS